MKRSAPAPNQLELPFTPERGRDSGVFDVTPTDPTSAWWRGRERAVPVGQMFAHGSARTPYASSGCLIDDEDHAAFCVRRAMLERSERVRKANDECAAGGRIRGQGKGAGEQQRGRPVPGLVAGTRAPTKQPCGSKLVRHDDQGVRTCSRCSKRPARSPLREGGRWRWCDDCTTTRKAEIAAQSVMTTDAAE